MSTARDCSDCPGECEQNKETKMRGGDLALQSVIAGVFVLVTVGASFAQDPSIIRFEPARPDERLTYGIVYDVAARDLVVTVLLRDKLDRLRPVLKWDKFLSAVVAESGSTLVVVRYPETVLASQARTDTNAEDIETPVVGGYPAYVVSSLDGTVRALGRTGPRIAIDPDGRYLAYVTHERPDPADPDLEETDPAELPVLVVCDALTGAKVSETDTAAVMKVTAPEATALRSLVYDAKARGFSVEAVTPGSVAVKRLTVTTSTWDVNVSDVPAAGQSVSGEAAKPR
jgi:hypothetical protein